MKMEGLPRRNFFFLVLLSSLFLGGCLGGGIDPTEDPVQPSAEDNSENENETESPDNADNENSLNNNNNNSNNGNNGNNLSNNSNNPNQGNSINNLNNQANSQDANLNGADEDFLNQQGGNNLFGNNQRASNNGNTNRAKEDPNQPENDVEVNSAESDINAEASPNIAQAATDNSLEPVNTAGENGAVEAPITAEIKAKTLGVVRYVSASGTKLYKNPDGESAGNLEQGDHPLVNEEGEWSRTSDGYYLPASSLTTQPVPRDKRPRDWR